MKLWRTLFLAGILAAAFSAAQARDLDEIKQSGYIKIAVHDDQPPFGYVDAVGAFQGYDVYFGRRIAADLGVKPRFVPTNSADKIEIVRRGDADITLANCTVTAKRAQKVDFALPYMKATLAVVSRKTKPIEKIEDLEGLTLAIVKGTTADEFFEGYRFGEIKFKDVKDHDEAYRLLLAGEVDAYSNDDTVLILWAKAHPEFVVAIKNLGEIDLIAPAVQKGNFKLINWLNHEIEKLGKENFFHEAYEKTLKSMFNDVLSADEIVVEGGRLR